MQIFDASYVEDYCKQQQAMDPGYDCNTALSTGDKNYILAAYLDAAAMVVYYIAGAVAARHAALLNERIEVAEASLLAAAKDAAGPPSGPGNAVLPSNGGAPEQAEVEIAPAAQQRQPSAREWGQGGGGDDDGPAVNPFTGGRR